MTVSRAGRVTPHGSFRRYELISVLSEKHQTTTANINIMKTIITRIFALGALSFFTSCSTTLEAREPIERTSTTTSQTTINRPTLNTVETKTTRSY